MDIRRLDVTDADSGRSLVGRVVGEHGGQPSNEAYCAAKFAVEGFMESLHPLAAAVGVRVSVVEPGAAASDFIANARLDPAAFVAEAGPYADVVLNYLDRTMQQFGTAAQAPSEVADVVVGLLGPQQPAFRVQTAEASRAFVGAKLADLDGSVVTQTTSGWLTAGR